MQTYKLDPLVADELLAPTLKPKVDLYPGYIYLILHFPAFRHTHEQENQEVDFVLGKDFLITTRYENIDPLHKFSKIFEVNSILDRSDIGTHAGFLFFYMVRKLYKAVQHELDYMDDRLGTAEKRLFDGQENAMVPELSRLSRTLLMFKQALRAHHDVLESFDIAARNFFGQEFSYHLKAIQGAYFRVQNAIESNVETLNELRATNDSLLSAKQNATTQTLTAIALYALPLTFVVSLFGVNADHMPIVGETNGFWILLMLLGALSLLMFALFRYKRWF